MQRALVESLVAVRSTSARARRHAAPREATGRPRLADPGRVPTHQINSTLMLNPF